ncbi:MAG: response regulator, partial [Pseudomonadota bacterium]
MPNTMPTSLDHEAIEQSNLVYIFEKSPALSEQFTQQLNEWGYEVEAFPMLDQLLAAFERNLPSVLVVNAGLMTPAPREALMRLRRQYDFPLVFISVADDAEAPANAVKSNADACFALPIDMPSFVKKLRQLTLVEAPQEWRLMVIDDSDLYQNKYAAKLEEAGIQSRLVSDPRNMISTMQGFSPTLALINTQLKDLSGLEAAMAIRQQEGYSHLPVIFFAQPFDQTLRRAVMKGISDDYLSESISPEGLLEAVIARFESDRQREDRRRRDDINHDWHTGFYTRQYLLSQLELFNRHVEIPHPLCLLYIQLDNFGGIRNIMGHTMSEAVIRETAQQLHKLCQRQDLLVRYDESTFAVLSQHRSLAEIQLLAEDICTALSKHVTVAAGQKVDTPCPV